MAPPVGAEPRSGYDTRSWRSPPSRDSAGAGRAPRGLQRVEDDGGVEAEQQLPLPSHEGEAGERLQWSKRGAGIGGARGLGRGRGIVPSSSIPARWSC